MKRLVLILAAVVAACAPLPADAAGDALRLRITNRGQTDLIAAGATPPGSWAAYDSLTTPELQPVGSNTLATMMRWEQLVDDLDAETPQAFIGVLAYHQITAAQYAAGITNDIAQVSIKCDDGPATIITQPTTSPVTGAPVYGAWIRASDFSDGAHECRAIGTPTNGTPIARSLTFNTNGHGTFTRKKRYVCQSDYTHAVYGAVTAGLDTNAGTTPATAKLTIRGAKESLRTSGGAGYSDIEIICPGSYAWAKSSGNADTADASTWWTRIYGSPSLAREDVVLVSQGILYGLSVRNILVSNLQVSTCLTGANNNQRLWLKGVRVLGPISWPNVKTDPLGYDPETCGTWFRTGAGSTMWQGGRYVSDAEISNVTDACAGCKTISNATISKITNNTYENTELIINNTIEDHWPFYTDGSGSGHPDTVAATSRSVSGTIVYGLTAKVLMQTQIFFSDGTASNARWSNTAWDKFDLGPTISTPSGNTPNTMQLNGTNTNIFMRDGTMRGQVTFRSGPAYNTNMQFVDVLTPTDNDYTITYPNISICGGTLGGPGTC